MSPRETHAADERCFFCADDDLLMAGITSALGGTPYQGPTVWMQKPMSFCPHATPEEIAEQEAARTASPSAPAQEGQT